MRRRSIRFQLSAWYAVVLTAGLGMFGTLIWVALRQRLMRDIDRDIEGTASRFERYFKSQSAKEAGEQLSDELEEFSQALSPGSHIHLLGAGGFTFRYPATEPAADRQFRIHQGQFTSRGEVFDLEVGA